MRQIKAPFDLTGPTIEAKVARGQAILPIAQVPHLAVGDKLKLIPGHCDPTVNLYDNYHVVQGGTLVKVLAWYDNEWGFSNRMLDTTLALMAAK